MTELQCIFQLIYHWNQTDDKADEYVRAAKQYGSVPIHQDPPFKTLLITHQFGEFTIWSKEPVKEIRR
jgi:hypothetical protein